MTVIGISLVIAGEPTLISRISRIESGNAMKLYDWVKTNRKNKIARLKWAKEYYSLRLGPLEFGCYELSETSQKTCEIYTFSTQYSRDGFISFSVDGREKTQKSFIQWIIANSNKDESFSSNRTLDIDEIVLHCSIEKDGQSGNCKLRKTR